MIGSCCSRDLVSRCPSVIQSLQLIVVWLRTKDSHEARAEVANTNQDNKEDCRGEASNGRLQAGRKTRNESDDQGEEEED